MYGRLAISPPRVACALISRLKRHLYVGVFLSINLTLVCFECLQCVQCDFPLVNIPSCSLSHQGTVSLLHDGISLSSFLQNLHLKNGWPRHYSLR